MRKVVLIILGIALIVGGVWALSQHAGTAGMCQVGKTWVMVNQQTLDDPPFGYLFCHKI